MTSQAAKDLRDKMLKEKAEREAYKLALRCGATFRNWYCARKGKPPTVNFYELPAAEQQVWQNTEHAWAVALGLVTERAGKKG